jgi:WS/DGAT/MGAT family acyltransferase
MHKLGVLDASFLYAETKSTPMNIASLQLLELPPGTEVPEYFEALKRFLAGRVRQIPVMTRKLKPTPFTLDQPVWVPAPDFDINDHVVRLVLPAPGGQRQLEAMIGRLHEKPLDRQQPLWAFYLIDGLGVGLAPSGRGRRVVGWYCKYHHACIDGMAGQAIIDMLFSDSPDTLPAPRPLPEVEPEPGFFDLIFDAVRTAMAQSVAAGEHLSERLGALAALAQRSLDGGARLGGFAQRAPRTPFNVSVGPYRSFAMGSLPLPAVRKLAKFLQASVNDVVLAVCADGLRSYLERRDALPDSPLLAGVPVSLRQPGDARQGNQVTMLIASLATDLADPLGRLAAIKSSMRIGKSLLIETRALQIDDFHMPGLPLVVAGMAQMSEQLHVADYVNGVVNVVISNVMGPLRPKYLLGARMLTHYPVSIPAHSAALNLTVQSYVDRIDLGVTACLDAVPDAYQLRDDILSGWQVLQAAVASGELQTMRGEGPEQEASKAAAA